MRQICRYSAVLIVVAAVVALPDRPRAATPAALNTISVEGEAEVRVVPDEVILSLGVETFDKVLSTAKHANDECIKRAVTVARSYAIPAELIQTDYIAIEPKHQNFDIASEIVGYVVRKTIVVTLRDIFKFEGLLSAELEAGVTHVHGVDFRTTALRAHRDEARTLALAAARDKAALLAKESGRRVGAVESISEASYGYWSSYGSWWGNRYGSAAQNVMQSFGGAPVTGDSTIAPGQISIRATVNMSFSLE